MNVRPNALQKPVDRRIGGIRVEYLVQFPMPVEQSPKPLPLALLQGVEHLHSKRLDAVENLHGALASRLFRAGAYRKCGLDPDLGLSFDYDLWIRMAKLGARFAAIPDYLANSRMHRGAKTLKEREGVFQVSMDLLRRHYGYVPFQWVFGYTAYRMDGRDQVLEPLAPTFRKYLASLPAGLRMNPHRRLRFLREWIAAPMRKLRH